MKRNKDLKIIKKNYREVKKLKSILSQYEK